MTLLEFRNAMRVLLNIDYPEFRDAVIEAQAYLPKDYPRDDPKDHWPRFRDNPHRWFISAPADQAVELWKIVEKRMKL